MELLEEIKKKEAVSKRIVKKKERIIVYQDMWNKSIISYRNMIDSGFILMP